MSSELCPNCGTLLTSSLKFCVSCRRSITEDRIRLAGEEKADGGSKYRLSKGTSYDGLRQARTFFLTLTSLLTIAFVYYFMMKFVIHQPIPFEDQLNQIVGVQQNSGNAANTQAPIDPSQQQQQYQQQVPQQQGSQ